MYYVESQKSVYVQYVSHPLDRDNIYRRRPLHSSAPHLHLSSRPSTGS